MKKIAHIICGGDNDLQNFTTHRGDIVIAVDKGYEYLTQINIKADIAVGDFDSLGYLPSANNVIPLNPEKDDSDTFVAIRVASEQGCGKIILYCGLGGRLSHLLYNINALRYASSLQLDAAVQGNGIYGEVCCGKCVPQNGRYVSIYPLSKSATVNISGMKYSGRYEFTQLDSVGLSNELCNGEQACIEVSSGSVLVISEGDI